MKLKDLIKVMGDNTELIIDGEKYDKDVPEEMLELEVAKINIKTSKYTTKTLEDLGYSFEVGIQARLLNQNAVNCRLIQRALKESAIFRMVDKMNAFLCPADP